MTSFSWIRSAAALALVCLPFLAAPAAQAQRGNASDISGPALTTGDLVNGAFRQRTGGVVQERQFTSSQVAAAVNLAATALTNDLASNQLASPDGGTIPAATQQTLLRVLTTTQSGTPENRAIVAALSQTQPGAQALAQTLVNSLIGLSDDCSSSCQVSAEQLSNAVNAFNALIASSSAEFLTNPPAELQAIRLILLRLVNAPNGQS